MPRKIIKDYFSFTRKERVGVIILVSIIIVLFIFPYLLPQQEDSINKAEWEQFKQQSTHLMKAESSSTTSANRENASAFSPEVLRPEVKNYYPKAEPFYFDPNMLDQKGWEKLGLRPRTISTIQNYLSKGGKFRRPEDLGKIYGLHENELVRLMPYVKINNINVKFRKDANDNKFPQTYTSRSPTVRYSPGPATILDINTADTTQLIALPGIGSKLAARIINFRDKLGAFHSIDQLADVYGLPDSTFRKLRLHLTISSKTYKLININTADVNELKQLPYLKWNVARAIVEFRSSHGDFKNLEELLQIEIFTKEMLEKMTPYLAVR